MVNFAHFSGINLDSGNVLTFRQAFKRVEHIAAHSAPRTIAPVWPIMLGSGSRPSKPRMASSARAGHISQNEVLIV